MKPQGLPTGDPHGHGHIDAGAPPPDEKTKSPSVIKRAAAEFLGAIGFVSMFAAIGNALIPAIATGSFAGASALAVGGTAIGTLPLLGVGLALAATAMAGSAALKKSMEKDMQQAKEIEEKAPAKQHPTQVIVNNIQMQPSVDVEAEANFFTKMIEAERKQLAQKQTER